MRALIIDGGGTSTDVGLAIGAQIRSRSILPSARPTRADQRTDELCRMIGSFLATTVIEPDTGDDVALDAVIIGMAGVWTPRERHLYAASFKESWSVYVGSHAAQLIVMSDVELVHFASYGTANGTVLIAGTGSIAVRKDFEGTLHRAGGWGHTVDDAGSGMWLGQMACKAVARMLDGRGPETLLIRPVASYLRVDAEYPDEVRAALRGAELRSISKIGGAVLTYAEEGDTVAQSIRALGAEELALMCKAVSSENHQQITGYGSLLINAQYAKLVSDIVDMPFALLDDVVASIPLRLG